ncbi:T6SS immunity protein Tdi1 domain-containing protein [Promicromonospora thailandica]|uniref:T6SS immunity protein Tdi1 C-terminal domain-containing protein n=1 Tax=Promicromonospora thailandica TaxID=765201 RepID=A0A9X2G6G2_9MICO|nr:T6SS immunity protein Tdi1 domain-containing protein [Promicromonospora thailandica]MCP2263441.1 protein of unknown function (DUF1851) [Promicromonospora thailandica]
MKLLRTFPKDAFEFGLASWQWLGLREQTPRFATCFGDIFLESLDGWWFLDTVEGTLELRWTSAVTMYAELESPEGRATYLMDDLVREARGRGLHLGEEDVYTFNPHPALGGELGVDSLVAMRFELAVNWVGQMHDQVLHGSGEIDLPPLPDGGRGGTPAGAAWDSAWSHDETFDVPFEQYLATTTFAAVARPRHGGGRHVPAAQNHVPVPEAPAALPGGAAWPEQTQPWASGPVPTAGTPGRYDPPYDPAPPAGSYESATGGAPYVEQGWHAGEAAPAYDPGTGHGYEPATDGSGPWPTAPADGGRSGWSPGALASGAHDHLPGVGSPGAGWAEPADPWSGPVPTDPGPPSSAWPEPARTQPARTHPSRAEPSRSDSAGPEPGWSDAGWSEPAWSEPAWSEPARPAPGWSDGGWGAQAPAVAAGGGAPQAAAGDPFTAWDDLWGKR